MKAKTWVCRCGRRNTADRGDCADCGGARAEPRSGRATVAPAPARPEPHRCAPDPDTGLCACGKRFNTRAQGKQFTLAIMDIAAAIMDVETGRRTAAEVHQMIDAAFAEARADGTTRLGVPQ